MLQHLVQVPSVPAAHVAFREKDDLHTHGGLALVVGLDALIRDGKSDAVRELRVVNEWSVVAVQLEGNVSFTAGHLAPPPANRPAVGR
jgi:hypothetical protein